MECREKMKKHKHHILPKHAGGTDDPDNLVELTVEEHAEAHRLLFEEHGRAEDEIAWKALSGQISLSEASRRAHKLGSARGGTNTYKNNDMSSIRSAAMKKRIAEHGHAYLGIDSKQRVENAKKARASVSPEGQQKQVDGMMKAVRGSRWWNNGKVNKRAFERPGAEWVEGMVKNES